MGKYDSFFLLDQETVRQYAVEVLHYFAPDEETACEEIGDGNINYVFRLRSLRDGRSLIVKQADRLLRSSGRQLDQNRSAIEAAALRLEGELAPGMVPEVYDYNGTMAATAMEDVSAFKNLRREFQANRVYPHLARNLAAFMVDTLLPTADVVLDAEEKKRRVCFYTNPELCKITEDLVLTEPYDDYKGRNILFPGTEDFVAEHLYRNEALHAEVAVLRLNFMNNAQALLHGDLHSGSVFANETGIRVLDPEFAFYGPMGYDIGNVIGNLFFALANKVFTCPEAKGLLGCGAEARQLRTEEAENREILTAVCALDACIAGVYDATQDRFCSRYDELVTLPLYRVAAFREGWLQSVMADAAGYAGTEIIRRTVGDSKVMEITSVKDPEQRIPMERALITLGSALIMNRRNFREGRELTDLFKSIVSGSGKDPS